MKKTSKEWVAKRFESELKSYKAELIKQLKELAGALACDASALEKDRISAGSFVGNRSLSRSIDQLGERIRTLEELQSTFRTALELE